MPTISFCADDAAPIEELKQYLLVCSAHAERIQTGHWAFTLETVDGELVLEADDVDSGDLNRLTLLAAVRGLEAIDGAGSVTLLSTNRYVIRSLTDALPRWRRNGFVWEHFGQRVAVQHAELWRRVDRALGIHHVEACLVSSRVVSGGVRSRDPFSGSVGGSLNRIDPPQAPGSLVPEPMATRSRRRGHRPSRASAERAAGTGTSDRLRRWLFEPPTTFPSATAS